MMGEVRAIVSLLRAVKCPQGSRLFEQGADFFRLIGWRLAGSAGA